MTGIKIITAASVVILLLALAVSVQSGKPAPRFIGSDNCRNCHDSASTGSQYKIWIASPHSKAYQTLLMAEASEVSKSCGIKDPSKDTRCLSCHATGGGKNPGIVSEGVGCEACHGPGSLYYDFDNHASYDNRENAYRKAVRLGMYPIIGDGSIKAREKLCRHCHNINRLCINKEDLARKDKKELPLSIIADFIYRHTLRR